MACKSVGVYARYNYVERVNMNWRIPFGIEIARQCVEISFLLKYRNNLTLKILQQHHYK